MSGTTGKGTLSFLEATSIIAGYGIGGGILAVPWLLATAPTLVLVGVSIG